MFRAGIVGCGRIASEFDDDPKSKVISTHAGAYSSIDEVELIALSDLDENKLERAGKRWGITSLYHDYKEMLRREKLDILSVCTWNSTHLEIVREAINNGVKAIFCEKPIADTLRNADEIIALYRQRRVTFQINHQRRFDRFHQEVKKFIDHGGLGRVQQVSFYYTAGIANTGSHMFDLLRFFFGDIDWVQAIYSQNKSPNPRDPNIDGIMKFRNGTLCAIQACDVQEFWIFEMDCIGTKGRLNITRSGFDLEFYEVKESNLLRGYKEIFSAPPPIEKDTPGEFMIAGVKHLIQCIEQRKTPISSGEDGRAALDVIFAFHESAKADGKRIALPLRDSKIEIKSR